MLLFPLRSAQGFYFPVLSRIENCQYPFFPPIFIGFFHVQSALIGFSLFRHPAVLSECSPQPACQLWMLYRFMFLFKPIWIAHRFKCSISKQQQQQKIHKTTPHQKIPQNLNPPYPPSPRLSCFKPLGYPTAEWHICHGKRLSETVRPLLRISGIGLHFFSWNISPLWHGRTFLSVFTFGSWRCLMVTNFFPPLSAENLKKCHVMSEVAEFFAHVESFITLYRNSSLYIYFFSPLNWKLSYSHEPALDELGGIKVDFGAQEENLWHPRYPQAFGCIPEKLQQF